MLTLFAAAALVACGGGPKDDAQKLCDCLKKANGMKADDPNRKTEQDKCMEMSAEFAKKYPWGSDGFNEFSEVSSECAKEMIQDAFK